MSCISYLENITPYKNRKIDLKIKVRVYRNLHFKNKKVYSIWQNGKVVGHTESLFLHDCKFIVNENCRQRIIRNKQKNVCAYISCYVSIIPNLIPFKYVKFNGELTFNPYINSKFIFNNKETDDIYFIYVGKKVQEYKFLA